MYTQLLSELSLSYRTYFESELAIKILTNLHNISTVNKISQKLATTLKTYKPHIINYLNHVSAENKQKFLSELYDEDFFGRLPNATSDLVASIDNIIETLTDKGAKSSQVMQLHCIVFYRLLFPLEKIMGENTLLAHTSAPKLNYSNHSFFAESRTMRQEAVGQVKPTRQYGFGRHPVFNKWLGQDAETHIRAYDKFILNKHAEFVKSSEANLIPIIAGPSGHTSTLLHGAMHFIDLSLVELHEYALACFGFLGSSGNHSFHEVMLVARAFGINYQDGNYLSAISIEVQQQPFFKQLQDKFPQYLESPAIQHDYPRCGASK
jgi:hypothetical protein